MTEINGHFKPDVYATGTSSRQTERKSLEASILEGDTVPSPSYSDGVRAVLDFLDKHRVDIEKALWYGNNSHTYDEICERVITGDLIFIPLPNSVMICEIHETPNYRAFHCFIAAGNLEELLTEGNTQLGIAAKALDCKYISMTGRRGWEPQLKKTGWKAPLIVMYKEVDNG